jgi:NTE family protein
MHGEMVAGRVVGDALRQCPGDEYPIPLEPEVPVQPPRVMLLDDEGQFFAGLLFLLRGYRLRGTRSVPFAPVCRELVHVMGLPTWGDSHDRLLAKGRPERERAGLARRRKLSYATVGGERSGIMGSVSTAFVLGGGGLMGAHEVGMLRALAEAGIRPDLVVGTSVGALNGVFVAADPAGSAEQLSDLWQGESIRLAFSETLVGRAARLARSGTHLHSMEPLRRLLAQLLPGPDFEDLELPFQCVAANIESASARWFSKGPVVPAVAASCAVPGLLPPAEIDGEHYFDGGLVDSIPVGRAVALGATTVYVLHAGRIESPLTVPRKPWQVALVSFEIARRHRFHEEMAALPENVRVYVLPTGGDHLPPGWSQFRYRDKKRVKLSIERAYGASADYLAQLD